MKVIINADDFGINEIVTSEIERMIGLKTISSTTIMANGKCLDEVKRFAPLHPDISYGVHLCLSEFSSITKSPILHKHGLTDEEGVFITKAIFCVKSFDDELKSAIRDELCAQIEVVKNLGLPLSHCDSHHHVHTIFALKDIFAEVIQHYGFKKVRKASSFCTIRLRLHLLSWIKNILINKFYSNKFCTTDAFFSYKYFVGNPDSKEVIELMCHPGHPGSSYRQEMLLVENNSIKNTPKLQIISYNEL